MMKKFLLLTVLAALAFTACDSPVADPRDSGYEFQIAAKYRDMVIVVPGGATREVPGEGGSGIFTEDKVLTGYGIAKYETTWELWSEVYDWALQHGYTIVNAGVEGHGEQNGTGGSAWPSAGKKTRPVTKIAWLDAVIWCNAYSELSGLEPVYYTADGAGVLRSSSGETELPFWNREKNGFRLPQETEWEYAARGGSTDDAAWDYTYSGGGTPGDVAWYAGNAKDVGEDSPAYGAHPAGTKNANRLGAFDMSGNAAEWCWDSYSESILEGGEPSGDSRRVVRGGSWRSAAAECAVKHRAFLDPLALNNTAGFRVARTLPDDGDEDPVEADETIEPLPEFTGLPGTKWLWGQSLLEFGESAVTFRGDGPAYTYTVSTMTEGQEGRGTITTLGDFIVNEDRSVLEIVDYRRGGVAIDNRGIHEEKVYNAVFMRRDPAVLTDEYLDELSVSTLIGTEWNVGGKSGGSNGDRFKNSQWLIFFTKTIAVNRSANYTNIDEYTFNKTKMRGWIYFINDFILQNWDNMYIPSYKQYGHDMWCCRVR
jgi:formylglycine-generating enzyme required for sulfatase activity